MRHNKIFPEFLAGNSREISLINTTIKLHTSSPGTVYIDLADVCNAGLFKLLSSNFYDLHIRDMGFAKIL